MLFRHLFLYNFRLKLTALLLATVVWFIIKFAIYREVTGGRHQIVRHQAVQVLKAPDDPRIFQIDPAYVDVVVQADREVTSEDLEVYLNLTTMPDINSVLKQVLVRVPSSAKLIRVEPFAVMVEGAGSTASFSTNSLRKP